MKHKTAELTGALLDVAVATAEGWSMADDDPSAWEAPAGHPSWPCTSITEGGILHGYGYHPAHNWAHGGPIIERERIGFWSGVDPYTGVLYSGSVSLWFAEQGGTRSGRFKATGSTPLIAAMRAYVAGKLGDEVDLPC